MNWECQSQTNIEQFYISHSRIYVFWFPEHWSFFRWQSTLICSSEQRCLHVEDPASVPYLPSIPHSERVVSSLKVELLERQLDHLKKQSGTHQENHIKSFAHLASAFICKTWDLPDLTPRQCPCIDLHCMLKSFDKNKIQRCSNCWKGHKWPVGATFTGASEQPSAVEHWEIESLMPY